MKFRVYPYKQGSQSAKALADALKGKVLKVVGSSWNPRVGDIVVNWGSSNLSALPPATVLNSAGGVRRAGNKLIAFGEFRAAGVQIPEFWGSMADLPNDGYPFVCRTVLSGHSGAGIVIANSHEELVHAQLYTKYMKKKHEYRVHVFRDTAFFIQRKAKRVDAENPNWQVRNLAGGFVFIESTDTPQAVIDQSIMAIAALGLDFGGVDVIWNDKTQQAYVLECNTACGLEERTATKYAEVIRNSLTTSSNVV